MHIYKIPLKTTKSDEDALNRAFAFIFKLHNQVVSYALKCFNRLNSHKQYHYLLKEYRSLKAVKKRNTTQEARRKEIGKLLSQIQAEVGLTKVDFEKFVKVQQKKYSKYISSQQAQKEAGRVWDGVSKVLFAEGKSIHYKKLKNFHTITGKSAENGIKFRGDYIKFGDLEIPCKLEHSDYEKETLNHKIKYCELVREYFVSGYRYYVNLYLEDKPPVKHKIGNGTCGIDPGVSTIATVSSDKLILAELGKNCKKFNKKITKLQQKIDVSTKKSNPFNYNPDGTCKEGKLDWHYSNTCKRDKRKLTELYRKKADDIKHNNRNIINQVLQTSRRFIFESMNYKALAKKAKKTENPQNEAERCKRRKRFGLSMNNRAPAGAIEELKRKIIEQNGTVIETDTKKCKASQYNHDTGDYIKIPLSQRFKKVDNHDVQRDLYSAFLNYNINLTFDGFKQEMCNLRFERFITMQDDLIANMKANGITMKQCFGF